MDRWARNKAADRVEGAGIRARGQTPDGDPEGHGDRHDHRDQGDWFAIAGDIA